MTEQKKSLEQMIATLQERAKELTCLYQIDDILKNVDAPLDEAFARIIEVIPPGWQYPDVCKAKIIFEGAEYTSPGFAESQWVQSADIVIESAPAGSISVYYMREMPAEDYGPFLKEETKLIHTIAERIGDRIHHRRIHQMVRELEKTSKKAGTREKDEWPVILKMLKLTDSGLHTNIARKMLNHLCWSGIPEAERFMQSLSFRQVELNGDEGDDWNRPSQTQIAGSEIDISHMAFKIASEHLSDAEILGLIQRWIQEDKLSFLVQVVNRNLSLNEVADAIRRYHHLAANEPEVFSPNLIGIHVSLIRRFLSGQLAYIGVAKDYVGVNDFYNLLDRMLFTTESHGKLGGKSAGMYLAAQILEKHSAENPDLANVKVPKTWYITSDILLYFMHHNNFDDVVEQKYKGIDSVRVEYPHVIQTFKRAKFPADIIKGLSMALDEFGDAPIIVRSSSLLEDSFGSSFCGKYKSLFLANQGSKQEKLAALTDAIAEVYASTFGPDPIEYRTERNLIDFGEEMGIMIQEVVGTRVGKYFLPSFAGVALSNNEFRWSPTIKREDGLIRLVPGLGTRAVDRLSDDYPIMFAPGQPGMRINVTPDEVVRYSPKRIDVINLKKNCFETISLIDFFREVKYQLPGVQKIVSVYKDGHLQKPTGMSIDFDNDILVATFDGLMSHAPIVSQMQQILETLEKTFGYPVDIEFASDGKDIYLLQCRPQSHSAESKPSPIPKDIEPKDTLFTAKRFVSNGRVPDITHIVYVDPMAYANLPDMSDMIKVGRAIGRLNKVLPKQQFILIGPGRWGSRGDIRLGVNVTYADINNSAMLIELAVSKGNYSPDLSFGTHFFQDLVETNIRYLPLYPENRNTVFNERYLNICKNILPDILPDFEELAEVIRLIDVPQNSDGRVLRVLMNADLDEAIGYIGSPESTGVPVSVVATDTSPRENYWHWRMQAAKQIAARIDPERFGVVGIYIFGSTKNATAGPASDIDLLIHFRGTDNQRILLSHWLEGWSVSLAELNYFRTGYRSDGLLDVHIITDKDIEKKTSYAMKIGALTDPARPLVMGNSGDSSQ